MNYYERHIGDYLKDTAHLSLLEHGIYTRLLDVYYTREAALPEDQVARLIGARSKDEKEALLSVLQEFFKLGDSGWAQDRCDREIERYQRKCEHNREVGKLGGRPKKTETQEKPTGLSLGSKTEPKQNPLQTPDTSNQKPVPMSSSPSSEDTVSAGVAVAPQPPAGKPLKAKAKKPASTEPPATSTAWTAYAEAYEALYHVKPVRNAKVNGQMAQLLQRLGADEAPGVAQFFLSHKNLLYVRAMHPVDLLLRDAEKLRTEWATNRQMTSTQAAQVDRTQTNLNAFGPLIAEAQAKAQTGADYAEH